MNTITKEKRIQILQMLLEGSSMRSIERVVGVSINTVAKLLIDAGRACDIYFDKHIKNVESRQIQADEVWAFCYAKDKNLDRIKGNPEHAGTVWLWTAIDPETKLIVSWWLSEERTQEQAFYFMRDLKKRLANRVQLSTDGALAYEKVVPVVFAGKVDFGQIIKEYEKGKYTGNTKRKVCGDPRTRDIDTVFMERHNLTTRMSLRRYTRKTNAHSKKWENHHHSLALYFAWYNFVRVHSSLGMTPAQAAGLTSEKFSFEWMLSLVDAVRWLDKHKAWAT